ncbi:MAG: alpha-L-fucosidase [bacterium]
MDTKKIPEPAPRIKRFESLAYGMFVHWGLYSQLGQGEWIQHLKPIPQTDYDELKNAFSATDFDARALARFARAAGMRYITLTTRHHEGFSLYDTRGLSDFDAPHSPAARDLVAEFVEGCRAEGIVPFLYHTTLDWRWKSHTCDARAFAKYLDYLHASVEVLCRHYGPIGGLWFDGNWSRKDVDWKVDRLYRMIRKYQPEAMIIDNTGLEARGVVGHPEVDSVTYEQGLPKPVDRRGAPKYIAGEMCQTMNAHWGIGGRDFSYLSIGQIIENLCLSRKAGANYLLNIGPTAQGGLPDLESALLRKVGQWIALHEVPIRSGKPVDCTCSGRDFVLQAGRKLYYFAFDLGIAGHGDVTVGVSGPGLRTISGLRRPLRSVRWLDNDERLVMTHDPKAGITVLKCTSYPYGSRLVVRIAELE